MTLEARQPRDDRPLGEIVNDLWQRAETLIRQELQLAVADAQERVDVLKGELDEKTRTLQRELIAKAIGGAVAFAALGALTAALILGLREVMDAWLAALLVGAALGLASFALLQRKLPALEPPHARELVPQTSVQNIKRDVKAIEEATE